MAADVVVKMVTTRAGVNYAVWWLGWNRRGVWCHAFVMNAGTKEAPRRDSRGLCVTIGLGLFAVGRGY